MTPQDALLALNAVPGMTNRRALKLIEAFGSAPAVFGAPAEQLKDTGILPDDVAGEFAAFDLDGFLADERSALEKTGTTVCTCLDESYPALLREIADAPLVIYVQGNVKLLNGGNVAIVGSRKASVYGLSVARDFGLHLAEAGMCVVSGLARGIDSAAHQGALTASGATAAVLGCGLNYQYPPENADLRRKITEKGAVLSEFPMTTPPRPYNFPRRNRIISGLSHCTVVIEAAEKSGALITADFALEQGRDVYAVPGKIDNPSARGTNGLIKQGAAMITSWQDVLDGMGLPAPAAQTAGRGPESAELSPAEMSLLNALNARPRHFDALMEDARVDAVTASRTLCRLEIKKLVKQLPGKYFVR